MGTPGARNGAAQAGGARPRAISLWRLALAVFLALVVAPAAAGDTPGAPLLPASTNPFNATRIVIVPGVTLCRPTRWWYGWLVKEMHQKPPLNLDVITRKMPDCMGAHESVWIPFMQNELAIREDTVLIGHSSGAEAAMRYAEGNKVAGIVIVSPCYTDLGLASERAAGWYNRPWEWDKIKNNTGFILQFSSSNDPLISYRRQQLYVADQLGSELTTLRKGHFLIRKFPELKAKLEAKLASL